MRLARTLMWLGILGAPAAWVSQFLFGYSVTEIACNPGGRALAVDTFTLVATIAAAALALVGGLSALRVFRDTHEEATADTDPPLGRVYFLSIVGMVLSPLFLLIIVLSGLGVIVLSNCHAG